MKNEIAEWERNEVAAFLRKQKERKDQFFTSGGFPLQRTYTPDDIEDVPDSDIGLPGRFPFTRGPYPTMYRSRTWTMRQIAGFGTGEDTNKRFKYLISQGQTGLSVDFDMPTLMGYDSDHPMSDGEVVLRGERGINAGGAYSKHGPPRMGDYAILDDLRHDEGDAVGGDGKADTIGGCIKFRVDGGQGGNTDQVPLQVYQRAAAIAGIDGRVGLNGVGYCRAALPLGDAAAQGADDAVCDASQHELESV